MLRKLTVENFFSIDEAQTLDLTIESKATDPDAHFAAPVSTSSIRLPKVVAFYGANASGKTNFLRAITFITHFIRGSFEWSKNTDCFFFPFLGEEREDAPTGFSLEFDLIHSPQRGRVVFEYELEICNYGKKVLRESLKYRPGTRMQRLFERTPQGIIAGSDFKLPKSDPVRGKIREDASVISTLAQFNHSFSSSLAKALSGVYSNVDLVGKREISESDATINYANNPQCLDSLKDEISRFDLGINDVEFIDGPNGKVPAFFHAGFNERVIYAFESQGTKNFYLLYPLIWSALQNGSVAILDEFDNDIHPLLLPEIVGLFQNKATNPHDAQLIISCHDASLLEYLTKEEVVFTEKDKEGKTSVYRLADVKGVRRDTNIYAKYLMGAFGGVPRVA